MNTVTGIDDAVVVEFLTDWERRYDCPCPVSAICFDLEFEPAEVADCLARLETAGTVSRPGGDVALVS